MIDRRILLASVASLEACAAPGCWYFDAAAKRLQARAFISGYHQIVVR